MNSSNSLNALNSPHADASRRRRFSAGVALGGVAAAALIFSVAACAPEPGEVAGKVEKEKQATSPETAWEGRDQPEEELQTTLPESFPVDAFSLPEGIEIYNAGERDSNQWFVVLRAADEAAATALWDAVVGLNACVVSDQVETTEGGVSATLSTETLNVQALTIKQADGSVLVSFDLSRMPL